MALEVENKQLQKRLEETEGEIDIMEAVPRVNNGKIFEFLEISLENFVGCGKVVAVLLNELWGAHQDTPARETGCFTP